MSAFEVSSFIIPVKWTEDLLDRAVYNQFLPDICGILLNEVETEVGDAKLNRIMWWTDHDDMSLKKNISVIRWPYLSKIKKFNFA